MGQDATVTVLKTSVLGTFRIFVVMLAGFLASKLPRNEPLLNKETCRTSSRVCTLLFQSSLVLSSVGSTLTPSTLLDSWQLVFAAGFTILMSYATAGVLGRIFLMPQDRRGFLPVQLAIAFPNSVAFPLLLMDALCQQDTINGDFDGDPEDCFTRATGMIFIYYIVWQILFFTWGFPEMGRDNTLELKLAGPSDSSSEMNAVVVGLTSAEPNGVLSGAKGTTDSSTEATNAGGSVAIDIDLSNDALVSASASQERDWSNEDTSRNHKRGPVSMHQAATSTAAENARESSNSSQGQLVLSTLAMTSVADEQGTSTNNTFVEQTWTSTVKNGTCIDDCTVIERRAREVLLSPNILAVLLGIVISLVPFLQKILFNNTQAALWPLGAALQTLGAPTVAVSTVVMAGSLVQVSTLAAANEERTWNQYKIIIGALHVGCRLIVVPAAGFTLFYLAVTQSTIMGSNRLMHVIILIQFAMPSAAFIIVSLNQLKMPSTAGFMARLYVVQYGLSMLTISAWTAVALRMVY